MKKENLDIPNGFETERLKLRPYQAGDGGLIYEISQRNRSHLSRYESNNIILSINNEQEAERLAVELANAWADRKHFFLGAFKKNTGEFVAQVYIGPVNWILPEFVIGFFVDVDHEGKGYVTEAVHGVLPFIFRDLHAYRVRLECDDTNERSWRVAECCGMVREGHFRENKLHPDGTRSGTYYYGLLRKEFEQAR
jgi:RimJ/RimL family protein N-acetyltransferase